MENEEKYKISAAVHEGITEIVIKGEVEAKAVKKLIDEVCSIAKELSVKALLIDVRDLKGRFGSKEAYRLIRNYPADGSKIRTAVVDKPEHAHYEFFNETTIFKVGFPLRWFTNINAARVWLKDKK